MMVKIERKITPKERENSTVRIDPNSSPKMNANKEFGSTKSTAKGGIVASKLN